MPVATIQTRDVRSQVQSAPGCNVPRLGMQPNHLDRGQARPGLMAQAPLRPGSDGLRMADGGRLLDHHTLGSSGSSSQLDLGPGVPPSPPHPVCGLRAQSPQESRQVSLLRTSRPPNPHTRSPLVPDRGPHCSSSVSHAFGHIPGLPSTRFREVILAGAPHPTHLLVVSVHHPTLAASTPACPCRTCS